MIGAIAAVAGMMMSQYIGTGDEKEVERSFSLNTVISVGRLKGSESEDMYWEFMEDERMSVSTAAFKAAKASDSYYLPKKIFDKIQKYGNAIMPIVTYNDINFNEMNLFKNEIIRRRHYINLLLNDSTWKIMQYLLYMYHDFDLYVQNKVRRKLFNRNYYAKVNKKDADIIRIIMYDEMYKIPKDLTEKIEFDLKYVEVK